MAITQHNYGLAAWDWDAANACHVAPAGAVAMVDFRPLAEQARQSQSGGYGLFDWPSYSVDDPLSAGAPPMPGDAVAIASGYIGDIVATPTMASTIRTTLSLSATPGGSTLSDLIFGADGVLGSCADPSGANGPKPIFPEASGQVFGHLAEHSIVHRRDGGLAAILGNPRGWLSHVRDVIRGDLRRHWDASGKQDGDRDRLAKMVGDWLTQCGWRRGEVKGRGKSDRAWERLLGASHRAALGAFEPSDPETTVSDDFNSGSMANWGSAYGNSGTWSNTGTALRRTPGGSGQNVGVVRFANALSSANQEGTLTVTGQALYADAGPAVRFSASAGTTYAGGNSQGGTTPRVVKVVSGAVTVLGSSGQTTSAAPYTMWSKADGSTISVKTGANAYYSVTDTAITGNVYAGCYAQCAQVGGTYVDCDNWSTSDISTMVCSILNRGRSRVIGGGVL